MESRKVLFGHLVSLLLFALERHTAYILCFQAFMFWRHESMFQLAPNGWAWFLIPVMEEYNKTIAFFDDYMKCHKKKIEGPCGEPMVIVTLHDYIKFHFTLGFSSKKIFLRKIHQFFLKIVSYLILPFLVLQPIGVMGLQKCNKVPDRKNPGSFIYPISTSYIVLFKNTISMRIVLFLFSMITRIDINEIIPHTTVYVGESKNGKGKGNAWIKSRKDNSMEYDPNNPPGPDNLKTSIF